jgi:hypothetical protein
MTNAADSLVTKTTPTTDGGTLLIPSKAHFGFKNGSEMKCPAPVKGKRTEKEISKRIKQVCQEDDKNLYLEARDAANHDAVIHRSFLKK